MTRDNAAYTAKHRGKVEYDNECSQRPVETTQGVSQPLGCLTGEKGGSQKSDPGPNQP